MMLIECYDEEAASGDVQSQACALGLVRGMIMCAFLCLRLCFGCNLRDRMLAWTY